MARQKYLLIPFLIALILAFVPAFLYPHPAAAKVDLNAGKGEAVWFYRQCSPGKPDATAIWTVDLNPAVSNQTSLNFQVKNAYPGYQLVCELYFANSGKLPLGVSEMTMYNPNSKDLILSASIAPGEQKKTLQPCGFKPNWGRNPAGLSSYCHTKIKVILIIGQHVKENSRLDFAIHIRLMEQPGGHD